VSGDRSVHVVGAGGHAKVVVATLRAAGCDVEAAWDDDTRRVGGEVLGVPVRGTVDALPAEARVVVAIGSNARRKAVAERLGGRPFASVVHPSAVVHPSVVIGPGTVVFAGAVVQPDTRLGAHVIVNTGASVDHDSVLEDFVHVAPGVRLAGTVSLREGAFLGIGACAVPGAEVGAWATVGAGGVVVTPIPSGATAIGCPARAIERTSGKA